MAARARKSKLIGPAAIPGAAAVKTRPRISPQLATLTKTAPPGDRWFHEIKFDGYRMFALISGGAVTFQSRNGLNWTGRFPALVNAIGKLGLSEAIFDGEVVHMLPSGVTSFSALQDDLSAERTDRLVYAVFDLLYLEGWDLHGAALEARKEALAAILARSSDKRLMYSDHHIGDGAAFFAEAAKHELEGIVSKRRDAPYVSGRSPTWLKVKCVLNEELIVVGYTDPDGGRSGFGALLVGYYTMRGELKYAGKVGTGFSNKFLGTFTKRLAAIEQAAATVPLPRGVRRTGIHWVRPEIVVQIKFTEWTGDHILRHPSFVGLREDKSPKEVRLDPLASSLAQPV